MTKAVQKITLSPSRDIPLDKLVQRQSNVRRVKAGVSVEQLAESIAQRPLLQSLSVRAVVDAERRETGMFELPAGGRRYRASEHLVKQERMMKTQSVPCVVRDQGRRAECIAYAGEAHSEFLTGSWTVDATFDVVAAARDPGSSPEQADASKAVRVRRGWFLGDGTGAGKGRQVAGILLDIWFKGRRRAVWIGKSDKPILS
jgi:hypothetical protein